MFLFSGVNFKLSQIRAKLPKVKAYSPKGTCMPMGYTMYNEKGAQSSTPANLTILTISTFADKKNKYKENTRPKFEKLIYS